MGARCQRKPWGDVIGVFLMLASVHSSSACAQTSTREYAQAASEYALKAAFLHKFASFVEWPPRAFPSSATPLTICIAGDDPFGQLADQAVQGAVFGARGVVLQRIATAESGTSCHIMFIGQNGGSPNNVRDNSILTITDGDKNPNTKGIIHFVIRGNRVRFEIDDRAAQQSGLVISSKLLSLAESVRPRSL